MPLTRPLALVSRRPFHNPPPSIRISAPLRLRPFSTHPTLNLKEDADRHPDEIDAKKHEQLEKQRKGEGHWHEELASSSESNVSADRENRKVDDHDKHMEELQQHGAGKAEKEKNQGER